jgi:hypothetical protein
MVARKPRRKKKLPGSQSLLQRHPHTMTNFLPLLVESHLSAYKVITYIFKKIILFNNV